jgi:hypothetical protein
MEPVCIIIVITEKTLVVSRNKEKIEVDTKENSKKIYDTGRESTCYRMDPRIRGVGKKESCTVVEFLLGPTVPSTMAIGKMGNGMDWVY